jgi:hypothetical protein
MRRAAAAIAAIALLLGGARSAGAQEARAPGDSAEYFSPGGPLERLHLVPYGDLRLRYDLVHNRPGAAEDLRRTRATLRGGLLWRPPASLLSAAAGVRASLGSERNPEALAAFDNEWPDTVQVDRLLLRIQSARGHMLEVGKGPMPLSLTEMIWDHDLRPVGIAGALAAAPSTDVELRLAGGAWHRGRFDADDGSLFGAQASGRYHPAGILDGDLVVTVLGYDDLHTLATLGYGRQNQTQPDPGGRHYVSAFQILDVQLGIAGAIARWPTDFRLDLARNLARGDERSGVRVLGALGGADAPHGLEFGGVFQWIEREALVGAFNSDDWWFHSRASGWKAWARIGAGRAVAFQIAGFDEKREDLEYHTRRVTAELTLGLRER